MTQPSEEPNLGDYPIIRARIRSLRREEEQLFRAMVRRKGANPQDEDKMVGKTFAVVLRLKPPDGLLALLEHWESTAENLATLDNALTDLFVACLGLKLGDYPIIHERLEKIYHERREFLRNETRRYGIRLGDEDEPIDDAYMALLGLKPQRGIRELLDQWERAPEQFAQSENLARLNNALTALFVTYLHFKCLDRLGGHVEDQLPQQAQNLGPAIQPFIQHDRELTLVWLDRVVEELWKDGELTEMEWRYWHWRRAHPEGRAWDFAQSLDPPRQPGGWIKKTEKSLFEKIACYVATRARRHEQKAEGERKKGVAITLPSVRSQRERKLP